MGLYVAPHNNQQVYSAAVLPNLSCCLVGDMNKVGESSRARTVTDPKTNAVEIDEQQEKLLVTSQEQIDKFVEDFLDVSRIGLQAQKVQKALKAYAAILADRNHDKVQYNLALKALLQMEQMVDNLETRVTKLQNDGFKKDDLNHLSQMAQMAEEIYSRDRARTMRLISIYRRAICLATLSKPEDSEAGGRTNDAALILPAAKLNTMFQSLNDTLFHLQEKAGSDAARYPPNFDKGRGNFVDISSHELQILLKYGNLRVKLPAPSREPTEDDLPEFRGYADVRVYRVRFWLDGIRIQPQFAQEKTEVPVKIGIGHEGDSVYYDRQGDVYAFAHDPIHPAWSYKIILTLNGDHTLAIGSSGDIVTDRGDIMAYAAPSPFASWSIPLKYLDHRLDLSTVTRGRFEFFGTTRDFDS